MSAQLVPIEQAEYSPNGWLKLMDDRRQQIAAISRGKQPLAILLLRLLREANKRTKGNCAAGPTGPLMTESIAEECLCIQHTANAAIRDALELKLFRRVRVQDVTKESGAKLSKEEVEAAWDGYVYWLLLENWGPAADAARAEFEAERARADEAAAKRKQQAQEAPADPNVAWKAQSRLKAGKGSKVKLTKAGSEAMAACETVEFRSSVPDEIALDMSVSGGVLTVSAHLPEQAGNLNYRDAEAVAAEPVKAALIDEAYVREVSRLIKPICKKVCSQLLDPEVAELTASNLGGAPVTGDFSYERKLWDIIDSMRRNRKAIVPGIFPYAATKFRASWDERLEDDVAPPPQLTPAQLRSQRNRAEQMLEFPSDYTADELAWARGVLGL